MFCERLWILLSTTVGVCGGVTCDGIVFCGEDCSATGWLVDTRGPGLEINGSRGITGIYFLRNLRLRSVARPEPSMRMTYWSNCLTSITTPVLSHLVGFGPR